MPPFRDTHWIANSFFGTIPNNPILNDIIENLKDEIYHGPIFFATAIKKYLRLEMTKQTKDMDIYNVCLTDDFIRCLPASEIFDKYAKHHALKSWHSDKI